MYAEHCAVGHLLEEKHGKYAQKNLERAHVRALKATALLDRSHDRLEALGAARRRRPDYLLERHVADETGKLPAGKTCGDCSHVERCLSLGILSPKPTNTSCDFIPSRFQLAGGGA